MHQSYSLQLEKFFFIWFSKDPDMCMPVINKMRLIRAVTSNPNIQFSLVYASECLSDNARLELETFTTNLGVTLIDFSQTDTTNELDNQLHGIAQLEIRNCVNDCGGNMAAASDCVRLFEHYHELYGNYCDLDVELNFNHQTLQRFNVMMPIIFSAGSFEHNGKKMTFLNNHFLGLCRHVDNTSTLHHKALTGLNHLKQRIIDNYNLKHPQMLHSNFIGRPLFDKAVCDWLEKILNITHSVMSYRRYLNAIQDDPIPFDDLYVRSVRDVSGPGVYFFLNEELHSFINTQHKSLTDEDFNKIMTKVDDWLRASSYQENGLGDVIQGFETCDIIKQDLMDAPEMDAFKGHHDRPDLSWSRDGYAILLSKSTNLEHSIQICQRAARRFLATKKISS